MKIKTESRIQQECFVYFHNTFPHMRKLYFRIKNENTSGINAKFVITKLHDIIKNPLRACAISKELIDYCRHAGRISGSIDKSMGTIAGVADSCLLLANRAVFIEFKTENGIQSTEQKNFQAKVAETNHLYYIIRSFNEFKLLCQTLGLE